MALTPVLKELGEKQRAAGSGGFQRTATFEHREALKNGWDLSGYQRGKEVFPDEAEQGKVPPSARALSGIEEGWAIRIQGRRSQPDPESCLPSRGVSPPRLPGPPFPENGPDVSSAGTLP